MRYLDVETAKKISKIGLGTWQFGSADWGYGETYARKEANAIVHRALELGVSLFDTAEIYGSGRSEEILGRALGNHRESVVLATKIFPLLPSAFTVKLRAAASARRIGTSRLDLYQVHFPNPLFSDTALMRGMRSLQQAGLIGEVGVSNYSLARWRAAEEALGSRIVSNQVEYSLVQRSPERELLPFAESHDRIVIAFSPLAMGLLSGKYHGTAPPVNPVRASNPHFQSENLARTSQLIKVLRDVADAHSASPAQIALAWVLHSPTVVAIPGASSVEQLESNVAAAEISLADDEYAALREASTRLNGDTHESRHSANSILRHSVRRGRYVAKIAWSIYRPYRSKLGSASASAAGEN
jgi:aryl-alcohol dehydrogenase-like predicted oxidoreductase